MSRLSEKLKAAAAVAPRQAAKIEARADAIIAREAGIESKTDEAFRGHEMLLDEAGKGLDALERELGQITNAPLEPSGDSSAALEKPTIRSGYDRMG